MIGNNNKDILQRILKRLRFLIIIFMTNKQYNNYKKYNITKLWHFGFSFILCEK